MMVISKCNSNDNKTSAECLGYKAYKLEQPNQLLPKNFKLLEFEDGLLHVFLGDSCESKSLNIDNIIESMGYKIMTFVSDGDNLVFCHQYSSREGCDMLRLDVVTEAMLDDAIDTMTSGAKLTSSEHKMLIDLLVGIFPREASNRDNISYFTKRNQTNSLIEKFDVSGQIELIQNVSMYITRYIFSSN